MHLAPRELEKIKLHNIGYLAQKRLARGILLNSSESIALIATVILELIRDGHTVSDLMSSGRTILGRCQVMPGISDLIDEVQIEGTFPDGTKLVTVHQPISADHGNLTLALYGSFLPIPSIDIFEKYKNIPTERPPGEILCCSDAEYRIELNAGRPFTYIKVTNMSDRPIQVGSHYHFIETNAYLKFDRGMSYGKRLDIASGTAVRFEPGDTKTVRLVDISGRKIIRGGNGICDGEVDYSKIDNILEKLINEGFQHEEEKTVQLAKRLRITSPTPETKNFMSREHYANIFGPTTGDIIRLGDTCLYVRVEDDKTVYGDECKFGGGKVLREGMGQATAIPTEFQLETVITNALIMDYTGIYKADVGLKGGKIFGIGKAGNPDTMSNVDENLIVGVNTEVIAGEGLILTSGAFDAHVHFICPQLCEEALASGITTMLGGGTGPATGSNATTCTPHPNQMKMMLQSTDSFPINFGFTGKGNTSKPEGLHEIITAGAVGLKLHEDWGTTPAAIDNCLTVADSHDIQVTIHTDTLNESCCVEKSISSFAGRTIHTYHSEGAGGGHAPDIIVVCGEPNVIPSSTNPTRPYTRNTIDEHIDMLMVCHHLDKNIKEDVAFAESRIRGETIAAEDILHDLGAISIMASDSQAMGRVGEVITRTWQTADKMKKQRGQLEEDSISDGNAFWNAEGIACDNFRVKRFLAKYTINPAVAHGMSHILGSIEVGKIADLVLWKPSYFGAKPELIIKGGAIVAAQMGDPNASIPTPEPVQMRTMYAGIGKAVGSTSLAFVSQACINSRIYESYGLSKQVTAVKNCRNIGKKDMLLNDTLPLMKVDPESYLVTADGIPLKCEPATELPLAQKYFLF